MKWQPFETIPMDGTEILIKTPFGIVNAWLCNEDDCFEWICYDDLFTLSGYDNDIEAWAKIEDD